MGRCVLWAVGLAGIVAVTALAGCDGTTTVTETVTVTAPGDTALGPPRELTQFGHVISLERKGGRTLMEFDPGLFLSGLTAQEAAAEDRIIEQGAPMPNDNYRVEEGDRTFTYVVAPNAEVTVLTNRGDPGQIGSTRIDVAELGRIVDGTSTMKLFEPLYSGVWLTIRGDRVVAIDQQYQP